MEIKIGQVESRLGLKMGELEDIKYKLEMTATKLGDTS